MTNQHFQRLNLKSVFGLNTASQALFRVLASLGIIGHLFLQHSLIIAVVWLPFAIGLLLGYRTRLMALLLLGLSLILIVSSEQSLSLWHHQLWHHDVWIALMCIWCWCLPVNAQWSVDAALQPALKENPNALHALSPRTYIVFNPITVWVVLNAFLLIAAQWFATDQSISLFPVIVTVTAMALFVPATAWESIMARLKTTHRYQELNQLIIHYDEDCGFCLKMCLILRELLLIRQTKIITAQSNEAIFSIMDANNSWVVQSADSNTHIHWHAMQHLFAQRWPFKALAWLMNFGPPMRAGNRVYAWIADNRTIMSRITAWALPWNTIQVQSRPATTAVMVLLTAALMFMAMGL